MLFHICNIKKNDFKITNIVNSLKMMLFHVCNIKKWYIRLFKQNKKKIKMFFFFFMNPPHQR